MPTVEYCIGPSLPLILVEPHGGTFTVQSDTICERVTGAPRFVSGQGREYFMPALPGAAGG